MVAPNLATKNAILPVRHHVEGAPGRTYSGTALVSRGEVDGAELAAKIAIVVAERRNYDPNAAAEILQRQAPDRAVVIDTTAHSPAAVAALIGAM